MLVFVDFNPVVGWGDLVIVVILKLGLCQMLKVADDGHCLRRS